jgi:thiol-disulfide isomerase/thioredoxin
VNEAANETSDPSAVVRADVPVGIRINQRAPDFLLQSLDNESVALSDFLGRVVILDFWASWCGPCKTTMPGLESLARALSPDVVLVGVSLDQVAANAIGYLATNHFDAMIALYESYAAAYAVFQTYGGGGIPKTYVIDRTGIIRYVGHPASLSRQTVERLI